MIKEIRKPTKIDYSVLRPSMTIPDQTLTVKQIVSKYIRGIPVDVKQHVPVYIDQNDHDLEKLNRMEFGDRAAMADQMRANNERIKAEHNDEVSARRKRNEEEAKAKKARNLANKKTHSSNLDNTMLDDTK